MGLEECQVHARARFNLYKMSVWARAQDLSADEDVFVYT